jgi:hypothetical protein
MLGGLVDLAVAKNGSTADIGLELGEEGHGERRPVPVRIGNEPEGAVISVEDRDAGIALADTPGDFLEIADIFGAAMDHDEVDV